jgi:carbonic anhydrase/acetyltransferase-like protein (isoleucine patch superfamily)
MALDQVLLRLDRFLGINPVIAGNVYIAPNATVLGDVSIGPGSSVWFQSVIRADINVIRIGSETNIQDGSILHVADRYGLMI